MSRHRAKREYEADQAYLDKALPGVICRRCGATRATYADQCAAALDVMCPGFRAIERALQEARARRTALEGNADRRPK